MRRSRNKTAFTFKITNVEVIKVSPRLSSKAVKAILLNLPLSKMGHRVVNASYENKFRGGSIVKIFIAQSNTMSNEGYMYNNGPSNFVLYFGRLLHGNQLAENAIATDTFEDLVSLKKL